eukprot:Sdes_comp19436_c0_seq1m10822
MSGKQKAPKKVNDADQIILKYLEQMNRPYSAIDIFNNLHGEIMKSQVVKSLTSLSEGGLIKEKEYGKSKVYAPLQTNMEKVSDEELKKMDSQISELKESLKEAKSELSTVEKQLSNLKSQLTEDEINKELESLDKHNLEMKQKLQKLSNGSTVLLSKDEISSLKTQFQQQNSIWRKRKRLCGDILDAILEGYPKSKQELFESIGIETDDDVGVQPIANP